MNFFCHQKNGSDTIPQTWGTEGHTKLIFSNFEVSFFEVTEIEPQQYDEKLVEPKQIRILTILSDFTIKSGDFAKHGDSTIQTWDHSWTERKFTKKHGQISCQQPIKTGDMITVSGHGKLHGSKGYSATASRIPGLHSGFEWHPWSTFCIRDPKTETQPTLRVLLGICNNDSPIDQKKAGVWCPPTIKIGESSPGWPKKHTNDATNQRMTNHKCLATLQILDWLKIVSGTSIGNSYIYIWLVVDLPL